MVTRMMLPALVAGLVTSPATAQPAPVAAGPEPLCTVALDAHYGHSREQPIQVGGSPMYGAARQRRYLDALRGPKGQALTYERGGSGPGPDKDTIVDIYSVRYEGIEKPVTLYLDWYHYTEPMAPVGFVCGRKLELGTPPPDPFQAEEQLDALAAKTVAAAGGPIAPIPLGDGAVSGFVLDRFRVVARPAPPGAVAPKAHRTIVVIRSTECDGRRVAPTAVTLANGSGRTAPPIETFTAASRFAALATGIAVADGSLGAVFQVDAVASGVEVRATFSGPGCGGEAVERSWPLTITGAELIAAPMPPRPAEDRTGAPFVAVQAFIDHGGVFREARALGGPEALVRAALEAIKGWRVKPASANGAPLATPVVLMVSFTTPPAGGR